jgi:hypothetical protein
VTLIENQVNLIKKYRSKIDKFVNRNQDKPAGPHKWKSMAAKINDVKVDRNPELFLGGGILSAGGYISEA